MLNINFNKETVSVNNTPFSTMAFDQAISLQLVIFNNLVPRTFENVERELRTALGRWPTAEEIDLCSPIMLVDETVEEPVVE